MIMELSVKTASLKNSAPLTSVPLKAKIYLSLESLAKWSLKSV